MICSSNNPSVSHSPPIERTSNDDGVAGITTGATSNGSVEQRVKNKMEKTSALNTKHLFMVNELFNRLNEYNPGVDFLYHKKQHERSID